MPLSLSPILITPGHSGGLLVVDFLLGYTGSSWGFSQSICNFVSMDWDLNQPPLRHKSMLNKRAGEEGGDRTQGNNAIFPLSIPRRKLL